MISLPSTLCPSGFIARAVAALLGLLATCLVTSCDGWLKPPDDRFIGSEVGAEALDSNQIRLTWEIDVRTTAYLIWQSQESGTFHLARTVEFDGIKERSIIISDLEPGTSYDFAIGLAEEDQSSPPEFADRRASATTAAAGEPAARGLEIPSEMAPLIAPPEVSSGILVFTIKEPHVDFLLTSDRLLRITFHDETDNFTSLPGPPISVRIVDQLPQSRLTFTMDGRILTSEYPLPEGNNHRLAVSYTGLSDAIDVLPPTSRVEPPRR